MDPLKATGTNAQIPGPVKAAPAGEKSPEAPADKVELGEAGEPGLVHKALRGMAKVIGGAACLVPGAVIGSVKAAGSEPVLTASPEATKFVRFMGAGMGLAVGFGVGAGTGPLGLALGLVAGPIVGAMVGGAVPGVIDGAHAAVKGCAKGAVTGMKKGAEYAGKAVDWVFNNFIPHNPSPKPPSDDNKAAPEKPATPEKPAAQ